MYTNSDAPKDERHVARRTPVGAPRPYKPLTTLREEKRSRPYNLSQTGPNIFRAVVPPRPTKIEELKTPCTCRSCQKIMQSHRASDGSLPSAKQKESGERIVVLEEEPDEILVLTDDFSHLVKTKQTNLKPKTMQEILKNEKWQEAERKKAEAIKRNEKLVQNQIKYLSRTRDKQVENFK